MRCAKRGPRHEIIDDLGQDPGPVDRVDAGQHHLVAEREVVEHAFDDGLAVVEVAGQRQGMDIVLRRCRHLAALHVRHPAVREQDEDIRPLTAPEGLDRRSARVTGGCADNGRAQPALAQNMVHHAAEQLHGNVLEGERRTVEQFQDERVGAGLDQRRHRRMPEPGIGIDDHGLQRVFGNRSGHERTNDLEGNIGIGLAGEGGDGVGVKLRPAFGKIKATVARQPLKQDI